MNRFNLVKEYEAIIIGAHVAPSMSKAHGASPSRSRWSLNHRAHVVPSPSKSSRRPPPRAGFACYTIGAHVAASVGMSRTEPPLLAPVGRYAIGAHLAPSGSQAEGANPRKKEETVTRRSDEQI